MKIKSITIEGMHNVDRKTYDFSNLTYLHGPNGVGKSTVMQAVQLALLGYIPGTAKTKAELFRHANNHTMAASLSIEDGDTEISVRRVWTGTSSSISSTVDIRPDGYDITKIIEDLELPIFNFGEFMGMTANKLKDWFIEFLPSMDVKTDWGSVLQEKLMTSGVAGIDKSLIVESVKEIESYGLSGIDEIRKANEYFKSMLSFKKKEHERIQNTVQSLIFYEDLDTTETVESIQGKLEKKKELQKRAKERELAIEHNRSIHNKIENLTDINPQLESYEEDPNYINYQTKIDTLTDSANECTLQINSITEDERDMKDKASEISNNITAIQAKMDAKQELVDGGDVCPFTKKSCESVQSMLDDYRAEIESYANDINDMSVSREELMENYYEHERRFQELMDQREELYKQITALKKAADIIKQTYTTLDTLRSQLLPVLDAIDFGDVDADIKELEDTLVKLKANKMYSETIDSLTSEMFSVDNEIQAYKYWIELTGVNGLQNMDGNSNPFVGLEDSMNIYLKSVFSEDVSAKFNLVTKANSFSFGIERNHSYIPFNLLSSGEKCLYTLALMLSLVKVSKSPLKIVMVDDLLDHLDNHNIEELFKSLQTVEDIQMIFAGVKEVSGDFIVEVEK